MDDNIIVDLFWERDADAIIAARKKYGSYCFSIANNILHSKEDSEECVNDTFSLFVIAAYAADGDLEELGLNDSLNDHVLVTHLIPAPGSDASYECEIAGWFEEATDIIITVSDKETGTLIEEQTVNVCYFSDSQAYQLTVTNVQTNDIEK